MGYIPGYVVRNMQTVEQIRRYIMTVENKNKHVIFEDHQMHILASNDDQFTIQFGRKDEKIPYKIHECFEGKLYPYVVENKIVETLILDTDMEPNTPDFIPVMLIFRNCYVYEKLIKMLEKIPEIYGVNLILEDNVTIIPEDAV